MDKNIKKVVEIMNEEFAKQDKWYAIFSLLFDSNWDKKMEVNCSLNTDQLIIAKHIIDTYIDNYIVLNEMWDDL